jgi:hypothetical protein
MHFSRYLKNEIFLKTLHKVNFILNDSKLKILDQKKLDINNYIKENSLTYELNIGFTPQVIFQEYSLYINDISITFEKDAMRFTNATYYSVLSLLFPELSSDVLSYGIDRINQDIEDFTKKYLSEALALLQEEFELNLYSESKEIH